MDDSESSGRKTGRPKKADGPRVPYDELDRLLVFGEVVQTAEGGSSVVYPSYRDLAQRYGVAHSLVAQYARKHDCLRRRKDAKVRVAVKTEQKLVEMRATALALSKDDALRMIDTYLVGFEKALSEGRVRFDSPTDFNTMLRLKEFILGGADSRQEIHAALSLEDIQARHQRMLRTAQQVSAEERAARSSTWSLRTTPKEVTAYCLETPRRPPIEAAAAEVPVQFEESAPDVVAGRVAPSRAGSPRADDEARNRVRAPHGANVAPTGPSSEADGLDSPENEDEPGGTRGTR